MDEKWGFEREQATFFSKMGLKRHFVSRLSCMFFEAKNEPTDTRTRWRRQSSFFGCGSSVRLRLVVVVKKVMPCSWRCSLHSWSRGGGGDGGGQCSRRDQGRRRRRRTPRKKEIRRRRSKLSINNRRGGKDCYVVDEMMMYNNNN